jgi:hypothetical protein
MKQKHIKKDILIALGILLVGGIIAFVILHKSTPNGPTLVISAQDAKEAQAQHEYFANWLSSHEPQNKTYDEQKELVDETIITNYAKTHNIVVSDTELQAAYQKAVASVGSEKAYVDKMKAIRGFDKAMILDKLTIDLLKEKIQSKVDMPIAAWLAQKEAGVTIKIQ